MSTMPKSIEGENQGVGLFFGDFTVEECGKYFGELNRGVYPSVEFLFQFEYSDTEEQLTKEFQAKTEINSGTQNGPTTIPEDSGVEVGQESEQELGNVKTQPTGYISIRTCTEVSKYDIKVTESWKEEGTNTTVKDGRKIVFGGESIMEKKEKRKLDERSLASPESESFPPLISSATVAADKQETEKLRKRRRKRRHRQRSGSISSSSSEGSEGRSPSSSSDRLSKPKVGHHAVEKDVSETTDTPQESLSAICATETQKTNVPSLDGADSLGSSHSNDTDNCISKTAENVEESASTMQQGSNESSPEEAKKSPNVGTDVRVTAKPLSWAALFKNSPSPSPGIVTKPKCTSTLTKPESNPAFKSTQLSEEPAQTMVPLEEDKHAIKLAEGIPHMNIAYDIKPLCPRGLINRANWCYINATLQALLACPLFFNLLRSIPLLKERGPTSTPILDSLVNFVHEFEILPKSLGKFTFRTGAAFEPVYVYKMLSLIKSCLSVKGRQEDAEEFLSCVLNGLHEEFLQLNKLVYPSSKDGAQPRLTGSDQHELVAEGWDNEEGSNEGGDWEQVGPRNKSTVTRMASFPKSVVSEIFGGYLRSSLHQTGVKESANVEPFFDLQLDIQTVSCIEEALKNLVVKEELHGYTCTKTKQEVDVSRRVTLESLPKVLILHLKRFIYSKTGSQKVQKAVNYPLELSISKELLSSNVKNKYTHAQKVYRLFAVIYHHGKMATGGHYTTDLFHPVYGWMRADDVKLKTVPLNHVLKPIQGKDPYVLFYRRTDL